MTYTWSNLGDYSQYTGLINSAVDRRLFFQSYEMNTLEINWVSYMKENEDWAVNI